MRVKEFCKLLRKSSSSFEYQQICRLREDPNDKKDLVEWLALYKNYIIKNIDKKEEFHIMEGKVVNEKTTQFLNLLSEKFSKKTYLLMEAREDDLSPSNRIDFLKETQHIREGSWKIDKIPDKILDRRVEITGPVERKMVINALNSGANVFMADFEDSNSPTWQNCINGQANLYDAIRRDIDFVAENGKEYKLNKKLATLFVRPRGLHLQEKNFLNHDGSSIRAALFDYGIFVSLNIKEMVNRGEPPCFYLPKLESYLEARLWAEIFSFTEEYYNIEKGTIKATVLVETLPLAFQMEEVLYELREYSAGLNCGRWDYIFSFMKTLSSESLPDRDQLTMSRHFMSSYTNLLVHTCHKRGAHAMGGMAAQIPIKDNPEANSIALDKVREDKEREVKNGHDGTWVAHPGLISTAKEVFDLHMEGKNQIDREVKTTVTREDLLKIPLGEYTEDCFRKNINIGCIYLNSWLDGKGCVPINNLMEDAATAEISRTQLWQWIKNKTELTNGRVCSEEYFIKILNEEIEDSHENYLAKKIFKNLCLSDNLDKFLTTVCYKHL
jgi:malate synthase